MPGSHPQPAKLTRPRLVRAVARERLFRQLDNARATYPAICVVGPPGAGKTTLVASWLAARGIKGIWYQVDAGDADLATFFYYLGLAARPFTRRGQRHLPLLAPEHLGDVAGFYRRYFRSLFSRLPQGAAVVLDNYQEVTASQPFHQRIAEALDEVPEGVTLVVVSRRDPPDSYARLIANEQVARIDADSLKLQLDEARAIAAARSHALTSDVDEVCEMSGGWAAGFTLLLERLWQSGRVAAFDETDSLRAVFGYLGGQVFDCMPASTRRLLLVLSYLPQMSLSAACRLTGSGEAASLLEDMHRRNLFTTRLQTREPTYRFHALLRSFLQDRAQRAFEMPEQRDLTRQAARILEERGQPADALSMYLTAGDPQAARGVVLREAGALIGQGRWRLLIQWIESLPQESRLLAHVLARGRDCRHAAGAGQRHAPGKLWTSRSRPADTAS